MIRQNCIFTVYQYRLIVLHIFCMYANVEFETVAFLAVSSK